MALNAESENMDTKGGQRWILWTALAVLWIYITYAATIYLELRDQILVGWGFFAVLWGCVRRGTRHVPLRVFILLLGAFLSLRYWMFRTFETLSYTGPWDCVGMLLLYGAESYGIGIHFLGLFVNIWPLERKDEPTLPDDPTRYPSVDILIPTYNEPEEIVRTTAVACTLLDYPQDKLNIYILDDGGTVAQRNHPDPEKARAAQIRHERLQRLAQEIGVHYMTREENEHAKAGNINYALQCLCSADAEKMDIQNYTCVNVGIQQTCSDLILILDCDHVPTRDFLTRTVPYFLRDEKLFLVQTPHFFINPTPVEKNLGIHGILPGENEMFYRRVHLGLDFWNASFFCGSAALMRRSCLAEVGGIQGETITEDAETALELHRRGYHSVYVRRPMVCGLSPETFDAFILQRSRWAQGMVQIFLLKNPLLARGLSLTQKLCYLNSCFFWFFGLARIVFFLAPLAYLFFGLRVYNASVIQVMAYALPHLFASTLTAHYLYGDVRHTLFSEFFETVQSIYLLPAILATFKNPRSPRFKVTPKGGHLRADAPNPLGYPFCVMLLLILLGLVAGVNRWMTLPLERDVVIICLFWNLYNLGIIVLCLGAAWELHQWRRHHRVVTDEPAELISETGRSVPVRIRDLSLGGVRLGVAGGSASTLRLGETLTLRARDSSQKEYRLALRIVRLDPCHMMNQEECTVGCQWVGDGLQAFADRVGFIYGDSERWQRFWESTSRRRVPLGRGYVLLLRAGIGQAFQRIAGTCILLGFFSRRMAEFIWTRGFKRQPKAS
ncbi:glycosyltransferase family 2 protein [Desulfosoma caldarium]|uniref:Cellulose synthase (UDP-forming) n=1 Tax=Desulfosoma caldarium TaxID=610254 RepID=A0A3N1UEU9_9BACT|nr:glycosyltransferase family 2 protein [Desulfosoma caldarium]ROQ89895.1 cellulose synthase (UDP-forming) [Desulfosoma caldarium]